MRNKLQVHNEFETSKIKLKLNLRERRNMATVRTGLCVADSYVTY
jgi:hypothetical protein